MGKRIQLNEAQLKWIIREAIGKVLDEPIGTDYGEFADVMEFLTPFFGHKSVLREWLKSRE
jgi:hypothetical protein